VNSFLVKICGITSEEDARVSIEAGANALGFNFYPKSPRFITAERATQIIERVPGDYLKVGVFVASEGTASLAGFPPYAAKLDVIQLHGEISGIQLPGGYRIWRAIAASAPAPAGEFEALLLDSLTPRYGGSGKAFDWNLARGRSQRVILAGGLHAGNVAEAVRTAHPWGVDACSRLESSPGKKNPKRVRDFVQAALAALQISEAIAL
jgi:phosphoribosylanthranilate isomerase